LWGKRQKIGLEQYQSSYPISSIIGSCPCHHLIPVPIVLLTDMVLLNKALCWFCWWLAYIMWRLKWPCTLASRCLSNIGIGYDSQIKYHPVPNTTQSLLDTSIVLTLVQKFKASNAEFQMKAMQVKW